MNPFRVWRSVVVCIVALATGAAIQGCPPATPCPCEGEQEGEGLTQEFNIVGRFTTSGRNIAPWDTRTGTNSVETFVDINFYADGKYALAFREKNVIVLSEDGTYDVDLNAGPATLDLIPEHTSSTVVWSGHTVGTPVLAVVETQNLYILRLGFKGSGNDWGAVRPAGYAVADFRLQLIKQAAAKSASNDMRLSDYLRAMGW